MEITNGKIRAWETLKTTFSICCEKSGGYFMYEDDVAFACARELLTPYTNVVLLLPSANSDESVFIS
jgi:hypothetical protein